MSNTTPNRIRVAGYMLHTTSTTAPSLTDPSLNTAYKNTVVTVGTDTYIVDATGVAKKVSGGAGPEAVTYGTAAPTATAIAGDRYFRTIDGTRTTEILEEYIHDGTGWMLLPQNRENYITALRPMYYTAGAWADAQANNIATVADAVRVTYADGKTEYLKYGKFTWPSHGLTVGANYWLDKTAAGNITSVTPLSGEIDQAILFVIDSDTVEVKVEQATNPVATTTAAGSMVQMFVNRGVPVTMDNVRVQINPAGSTLQIAAVSGSFNARGSTSVEYSTTNVNVLHIVKNAMTVSTVWQSVDGIGYSISAAGGKQVFDFIDITNLRRYRVSMIINDSYINNHICIERLA